MNTRAHTACPCTAMPAPCAAIRFACNSTPRSGICGSDLDDRYEMEVARKPTVSEVVRMAVRALQLEGGQVYFCSRSSNRGATIVSRHHARRRRIVDKADDEPAVQYLLMPGERPIASGDLEHVISSLLLSLSTDAISIGSSAHGTIVYNRGEIAVMSTY